MRRTEQAVSRKAISIPLIQDPNGGFMITVSKLLSVGKVDLRKNGMGEEVEEDSSVAEADKGIWACSSSISSSISTLAMFSRAIASASGSMSTANTELEESESCKKSVLFFKNGKKEGNRDQVAHFAPIMTDAILSTAHPHPRSSTSRSSMSPNDDSAVKIILEARCADVTYCSSSRFGVAIRESILSVGTRWIVEQGVPNGSL